MKKFQLKYSAPKTKVNSAGKVEQQNQKKPDRYCDTCSTITDIISKEPQSEEKSYKLTGSALFNKMFSDIKKAHIPVCSFSVYDSDFTFCYGNVINNRAVLLNYYSLSSVPLSRRLMVFFRIRLYVLGLFTGFTFRQTAIL